MSESRTQTDLELPAVWAALVAAGACVYEWCESGVATGCQVIRVGDKHCLTVSDAEGYTLEAVDAYEDSWELVPADGYDDDAAVAAASDLDGWFGVVGLIGSAHHRFEWFETYVEADAWVDRVWEDVKRANHALGFLGNGVLTAAEAFERKYLNGNRVYFDPKQCGPGYEPKR